MRAVVQRVTEAAVFVDAEQVAGIGAGLLILLGVTHSDTFDTTTALAAKIANLRILRDGARDESSALDTHAPMLVVSQFTLYADTRRGRRPSWAAAAPGDIAQPLVDAFANALRELGLDVATGMFGATMAVKSTNDGPFTIVLEAE
jgi:D-tyrosyl-tRNA(Tyr) deacylase